MTAPVCVEFDASDYERPVRKAVMRALDGQVEALVWPSKTEDGRFIGTVTVQRPAREPACFTGVFPTAKEAFAHLVAFVEAAL